MALVYQDESSVEMERHDGWYATIDGKTSGESLWANMEPWQRILGGKAVPFAEDGGGNQFFLDLNTVPASVKVCVHDDNFLVVDLASCFAEFIDGLAADPDYI